MEHQLTFDNLKSFPSTQLQSPRKNRRLKSLFIFLLVTLLMVGAGYWGCQNDIFNIFQFSYNQQTFVTEYQQSLMEDRPKGKKISQEKLDAFRTDYRDLLAFHPGDPLLFYHCGSLEYAIFTSPLKSSYSFLSELFLLRYIGKYKFSKELLSTAYQNALILLRKAIVLNLPDNKLQDAQYKLNFLYLFSGTLYTVRQNTLANMNTRVRSSNSDHTQELIYVITAIRLPNWRILKKYYPPMFITYLKAIYYLSLKNTPFGFSLLQNLVKKGSDLKEEKVLINNALYLMGYIKGVQQGKRRSQFDFYSQLDLDHFMQKYDWFFDEYLFLLRFLGKTSEQKKIISQFQGQFQEQPQQ